MAVWSEVNFAEVGYTTRLDAEYYQPKFLRYEAQAKRSGGLLSLYISDIIQPTEFIREYVAEADRGAAIFWRAQNVRAGYIDTENIEYIDAATFLSVPNSHVQEGDILITRTGANAGDCAVVPEGTQNVAVSSHTLRLVPHSVELGYAIGTFFSSDLGRDILFRTVSGSSRPQITKEMLSAIRIPDFSVIAHEIARDIRAVYAKRKEAKTLYAAAENVLLHELGLDLLDLSHELTYERNFSEVAAAGRYDAQYFMPRYQRLLKCIGETGEAVILGAYLKEPIQRGIQPEYVIGGEFLVINSQHVGKTYVDTENNRRTSAEIALSPSNKRAVVHKYDVLLNSTGDNTIGRCQVMLDDQLSVVDGHISIIRSHEDLDPVYLSLFLNSKAGYLQTERGWTGSSGQIELRPEVISGYTVWRAPQTLQMEIRRMVEQSYKSHKDSQQLLKDAKRRVEQMILGEET
jgi:restriction endonuclease S subunit